MEEQRAADPGGREVTGAVRGRSMYLRTAAAIVALGVIAAALLLLHGRTRDGGSVAGVGALDSRIPVVNQPAPNFALTDMDGHVVRLSDLRGQVVFVNFWATWCVPCRQELPAIEQAYRDQRGQGFTVLEVNEQEAAPAISSFAKQMGELPPIVLDRDGAVMQQYHLKGLPDSFIMDRQGVVRGLSFGPVSEATILKYIDTARKAGD